jgi:threonine 3-dehydrogenase
VRKKEGAMKAVLKAGVAPGVEIREVPVPDIGDRDVLVRVKAAAICGSDIHLYHSAPSLMAIARPPFVMGHEACGEVVTVGAGVTRLRKGDLVAMDSHISCGVCYQCQTGGAHVCEQVTIFGVQTDGAFAEYARVPEVIAWKLAPGTSADLGAIMEPFGVGLHGVMVGEVSGRSVAVFGCGPIGIFAIQVALALGASQVFATEVSPSRLALARECAPEAVLLNPGEVDVVAAIREAIGGRGADVALEYTGAAEAVQQALAALRPRGRLSLVGVPTRPVEIDLYRDIIIKELQVVGVSGRLLWDTWWQMQKLFDSGKVNPLKVVTHRLPLTDFDQAIKLAASGGTGKILLYP